VATLFFYVCDIVGSDKKNGIDYDDIMEKFIRWDAYGEYTQEGQAAFDQGGACLHAIHTYRKTEITGLAARPESGQTETEL